MKENSCEAANNSVADFDINNARVHNKRDHAVQSGIQGNEALTPAAVLTIPSDSLPEEWAVRIVPNRYPAIGAAATTSAANEFFSQAPADGFHEVIVESPSHELAMRNLSAVQIFQVVRAWQDRLANRHAV
jgi:UDPglucose--hexose-1-phosphate uridylyltransferase